jgi:hypothetical protein
LEERPAQRDLRFEVKPLPSSLKQSDPRMNCSPRVFLPHWH